MRKFLLLFLFLCSTVMLHATVRGTHLNRNLRQEHIPVEQATQMFGKWMKTSNDMSFVLVKDETDELGFRHQTYEQFQNGIPVDAARLMVHSKDGKVTYVNGYVMETDAAPTKKMKARGNTPHGDNMVLVEVDGEFRYAVKTYDDSAHEYVYTDVETGQVVKRLPTIYHVDAPKGQKTINSESYYYGTQQMDVTQLDDGIIIMADSIRKIYTYDATGAGAIPERYDPKDSLGIKNYFDKELTVVHTKRKDFSMQEIVSATISLSDAAKKELGTKEFKLVVFNNNIAIVTERNFVATDFPYVFNSMEHKSKNGNTYPLRQNDTDTTLVVLVNADDNLMDVQNTAIDILRICPTEEGGNAEVTAKGQNGLLFAKAALKGIGHYGVDVHWGIQRVYDYYKTKFNYNSYDNTGSPIINIINPIEFGKGNELLNITEPNAFACQRAQPYMVYGRGAMVRGSEEQVDISVTAHEFTHLVTYKTSKLEYWGEPGALNEAFSDIFGVAVKKYVVDHYLTDKKGDIEYIYSIGTDSERTSEFGMNRFSCDPWRCGNPKAVLGKNWVNPLDIESDNGGVHINGNVLNFWFYLLAEGYDPNGKYAFDTSVVDEQWAKTIRWEGIGIEKAERIAFRMLTRYMFTTANFHDAYNQSFVAAQDLGYDENSTEYKTIQLCWKAVAPLNFLEVDLTDAVSLEITSVATSKTYAPNSVEMIPYTGSELKTGIVGLTLTATLKDAAKLRKFYMPNQNLISAKCYVDLAFLEDYHELDYSDFLNDFLKKCYDDVTVGSGYQETYTKELTLECGGPLTVTLDSPLLALYVKQDKELLEDARTFPTDKDPQLVAGEGKVNFRFFACSGYPIKVLPQKSGETVFYRLYLINEDKSETELDASSEVLTEEELLENTFKKDAKMRYKGLFSYENANLSKPGTYKLKVSFTWAALKDAEFTFEVKSSASDISELSADSPADSGKTYDLQGRVVNPPRKGVYIRDGKKIIVQ